MKNISLIHNCFGCGICSISCPKHIVKMRLNADGFYEPYITDESKCINCSLCLKNCSFYNTKDEFDNAGVKGFASWSKNADVRKTSSSGGTGYEIAKHLVGQGYIFCGVKYDAEKGLAIHYLTEDLEELKQSAGSKYIQSDTTEAFSNIDFKKKYVVVGTPCQIASLRRIIKRKRAEKNFFLVDFFCHGVPSMLLWDKYKEYAEKKVGPIGYASWRNKATGWHDSWAMKVASKEACEKVDWHDSYNMLIREKKGFFYSRWTKGDLFYRYFLGHQCMGRQCTKSCRFKMTNSYADIRIGDLWGDTYKNEDKGVTGVLALTERGRALLGELSSVHLIPEDVATVCEGQMASNAHAHPLRPFMFSLLKSGMPLERIDKIMRATEFPLKAMRKLRLIKY